MREDSDVPHLHGDEVAEGVDVPDVGDSQRPDEHGRQHHAQGEEVAQVHPLGQVATGGDTDTARQETG